METSHCIQGIIDLGPHLLGVHHDHGVGSCLLEVDWRRWPNFCCSQVSLGCSRLNPTAPVFACLINSQTVLEVYLVNVGSSNFLQYAFPILKKNRVYRFCLSIKDGNRFFSKSFRRPIPHRGGKILFRCVLVDWSSVRLNGNRQHCQFDYIWCHQ